MNMTGERRIPAPRQKVWNSLNDPQVLKTCIPGCEKLERTADNEYTATAAVKLGPIAARFNGRVNLLDLDEPNSYRIQGEGQGGVAGFAKGGATVRLADDGSYTLLTYDVNAQVGGKIAQLGARLIDASSRQMADQFFTRFTNEVAGPAAAPGETPTAAAPDTAPEGARPPPEPARAGAISVLDLIPAKLFGLPRAAWAGIALALLGFGTGLLVARRRPS